MSYVKINEDNLDPYLHPDDRKEITKVEEMRISKLGFFLTLFYLTLGSLIGVCGVLFAQSDLFHKEIPENAIQRHPSTDCNAVWLEHTWLEDEHSDEEVLELSDNFKSHDIGCVYVHTTPLNDDGSLDYTRLHYTKDFIRRMNSYAPEITVYAWVAMMSNYRVDSGIGYKFDFSEYERIDSVRDSAIELVDDFGFDGIHINVEPMESGNPYYLIFLADLHGELQLRDKPLSVAVHFHRPNPPVEYDEEGNVIEDTFKYIYSWKLDYYFSISRFVDQMVVMTYNKGLETEEEYSAWIEEQGYLISAKIPNSVNFLIGVPAYDEYKSENIYSALNGVSNLLEYSNRISGVSIYIYSHIGESEWDTWDNFLKGTL